MSDAVFAAEIIAQHFVGKQNILEEYEKTVVSRYEQYLSMRKYFYQLEKRWPESPFWLKYQDTSVSV